MENQKEGKMTLAQYEGTFAYYKQISDDALAEASKVREKYLSMAPFQPGDKVRIAHKVAKSIAKGGGTETIQTDAYIKNVKPGSSRYQNGQDYDYEFSEIKKDGTPSAKNLYIYQLEKIEKI